MAARVGDPELGRRSARAAAERAAGAHDLRFVVLDPAAAGFEPAHQAPNPLAARLLTPEVCHHFALLPIAYRDGVITVATATPGDGVARQVATLLTGRPVELVVAAPDDLARAIAGGRAEGAAPTAGALSGTDETSRSPPPWAPVAPDLPTPRRLGELCLDRGLITADALARALADGRRTGARLGEVLVHDGLIEEHELASVLADQFGLPLVDVAEIDPDPEALALIPAPLARHLRAVPIGRDTNSLYLVIGDLLDDDMVGALREHTHLELRGFLAPPNDIDELLARVHPSEDDEAQRNGSRTDLGPVSTRSVLSPGQRAALVVLSATLLVLLLARPGPTLIGLAAIGAVVHVTVSLSWVRIALAAPGGGSAIDVGPGELAGLDERTLPRYSILVPLRDEIAVLPRLIETLGALDYPRPKLDVRLVCGADDTDTVEAITAMGLPPHFRLVVLSDPPPITRPQACNHGLLQADGEYVAIYEAGDRPEPGQLKRALVAFGRAAPEVACVQARRRYSNAERNLLTRWLACENAWWSSLMVPGLAARHLPVPLGGASHHFLRRRLVELGGWDASNGAADAELGVRLHRAGYRTAVVNSTTREEAPSEMGTWLDRRSRRIRGGMQSWLVHMRHPTGLLGELGARGWLSFQLVMGGAAVLLLNPILWALTALLALSQAHVAVHPGVPGPILAGAVALLVVGNFVFMYLSLIGALEHGEPRLAKYALAAPVYSALLSIAAWRALLQLALRPPHWDTTADAHDETAS